MPVIRKERVCKPSSVSPSKRRSGDHLSRSRFASGLKRPTRRNELRALSQESSSAWKIPIGILGLAGGGVYRAIAVANNAVRSYRSASLIDKLRRILRSPSRTKEDTISPLPFPALRKSGLCIFCGTFPYRTYLIRLLRHKFLSIVLLSLACFSVCDDEANRCGRWLLAITVPCPARTFLPALTWFVYSDGNLFRQYYYLLPAFSLR